MNKLGTIIDDLEKGLHLLLHTPLRRYLTEWDFLFETKRSFYKEELKEIQQNNV